MNYKRVRILNLSGVEVEELPSAIGKMKQLRCLNLTYSYIHTLPHTFFCLYNLQILILNRCFKLKSLPKNIRRMTNLRHILLEGCRSLSHMPYRIGELASLKTLSLFIVGDRKGNQIDELEHLNLGGKLEIKHLESVKNHLIAKKANLIGKPNLRALVLHWQHASCEVAKMMEDEKVLEALEPHPNLVTLKIHGFQGRELALWVKGMKNITYMTISSCRNCRHLSALGDLPLLKYLWVNDLEALEYIVEEAAVGCEIAKFPSLEKLELSHLPNLKEGEVKMFPNLKTLQIWSCKSLRRLPSTCGGLNSLTKLWLYGCNTGGCFPDGSLRHLTSLEMLELYCTELEDDVAVEMKHLHRLRILVLRKIDGMVSLPQGLQHIPSLDYLNLRELDQLTSLPDWLSNLASLSHLEIELCPAIPSLPSSIQRMTNLKKLSIRRCPQLGSRIEEETGDDWHKISHIPHLKFEGNNR